MTGALLHARCRRIVAVAAVTLAGALAVALVPTDRLDATSLAPGC